MGIDQCNIIRDSWRNGIYNIVISFTDLKVPILTKVDLILQAYTVELEAELDQLKQENAHLKQALVPPLLL